MKIAGLEQILNEAEKQKKVPILSREFLKANKKIDVLVCGGGISGVAAAIAAARDGAKTLIVEQYGFLGGAATTCLVGPFMPTAGEGGIYKEILTYMGKIGAAKDKAFDSEILKYVLLKFVKESGANLLLHTFIESAITENNTVKGIYVINKTGREAILAKITIDATGDGDVAASAGCEYAKAEKLQAVSLLFKIGGINEEKIPDKEFVRKATQNAREAGELSLPDYIEVVPLGYKGSTIRPGEVTVNVDMLTGINGTNVTDLTKAEIEAREKVFELINFYRKYIPGYERCFLLETASQIGIRETRRIIGEYILTGDDVRKGRKFHDVIAICSYPIDLHDADYQKKNKGGAPKEGDWYDIPYRCLIPKKIENLLIAGRCISSDREANGSLRIMPTCFATGQAAGIAASLSIKKGVCPRKLNARLIQRLLLKQGASLG